MKILVYIPFLAATLFTAPLHAQRPEPLVSPEIRLEAAQSYLQNQTTQIGVYAKGLVCSSCGIGLRVHLSKLDSIDKKQFKKGIFLDASKQLLILALKPGAQADIGAIRQAIVDAGYDPSQYFLWKNGEVEVHSFSKES
ncbi:MAG: hypothetical protein CNE95_04190 [Puniceicoccaceae bacterium MED-G30]|jgi:hypothetical protein|nr:MAG: hypothetical protein CNE95_04190 [Puniceicoccaceae bacterium MED-G30]